MNPSTVRNAARRGHRPDPCPGAGDHRFLFVLPLMSYASTVLRGEQARRDQEHPRRGDGGWPPRRHVRPDQAVHGVPRAGRPREDARHRRPRRRACPACRPRRARQVDTSSTNKPGDQRFALDDDAGRVGARDPAVGAGRTYSTEHERHDLAGVVHLEGRGARRCRAASRSPATGSSDAGRHGQRDPGRLRRDRHDLAHRPTRESTNDKVFRAVAAGARQRHPAGGGLLDADLGRCRAACSSPGTYIDDVVLSGSTRRSTSCRACTTSRRCCRSPAARRGTNVVVGTGPRTEGCVTSDNIAALEAVVDTATNTYPNSKQLDGSTRRRRHVRVRRRRVGSSSTTSSAGDISFVMNRRLQQTGKPEAVMNDVSIVSVDGVTAGAHQAVPPRDGARTVELDVPRRPRASSTPASTSRRATATRRRR